MKPLTDAQRRGLEAVERGDVGYYRPWRGSGERWQGIRAGTAERLKAAGLIALKAKQMGDITLTQPAILTDSGHAALQEARG